MHDTIVASGHTACSPVDAAAAEKLRLLARWLRHCHEQARQRGQLGVLAPSFREADLDRMPMADMRDTPG